MSELYPTPPHRLSLAAILKQESQWPLKTWLMVFLWTPLFLLGGGSGVWLSLRGDQPAHVGTYGLAGIGLGIAGVGTCIEFFRVLHRRGATLGISPDGHAATVITRPPWTIPAITVVLAGFVAWPTGSLIIALVQRDWGIALFAAPFALWLGAFLVPIALGQVQRGALYLTPQGIHHVWVGAWWTIDWDDVRFNLGGVPLKLQGQPGTVRRGRTAFFSWKGRDRWDKGDTMAIDNRWLSVGPSRLDHQIEYYLTHPDQRHTLGTPTSLAPDNWRARADQLPRANSAGPSDDPG
ncbi:MAG: hypothetical protein ACT4PP_10275 [Sporichthyaceae bacterium]